MKKRFQNKLFLLALASLIYQVLTEMGVAPPLASYQLLVDVVSYLFIGAGVYKSFEVKPKIATTLLSETNKDGEK